jgi:hypothetical protein
MEEAMHWTERRKAKAALGLALRARGWTLYGFHEDRSDPMTYYWAPATWDGVAEKRGYVVVVDISAGSSLLKRSGSRSTAKQPPGDNCDRCETTFTWPGFRACLPHKLWHVEKDGRILESGIGLGPCADYDKDKAVTAVNCIVDRIEAAIHHPEGNETPGTATTTNADGVIIRRNLEKDGIEVIFPAKPDETICAGLKRLKFRWSRRQGLWYARYSASLWDRVHQILDLDNVEPADPGTSEQNGLARILLDEPETETIPAAILHGTGVGLDWPVPLHARKELRRREWQPLYEEDEAGKTEAWLCPEGQNYSQVIAQVYALDPNDEGPLVRVFTWPRPVAIAEPGPPSRIVIRRAEIEWSPDGHLQARDLDSGEIYVPHSPQSNAPHQLALF